MKLYDTIDMILIVVIVKISYSSITVNKFCVQMRVPCKCASNYGLETPT